MKAPSEEPIPGGSVGDIDYWPDVDWKGAMPSELLYYKFHEIHRPAQTQCLRCESYLPYGYICTCNLPSFHK